MIRKLASAAAMALAATLVQQPAQSAESGVKAGFLTCNVDSGWGFVFGSSRELKCTYSNGSGATERYVGHIRKFGVDIGYTSSAVIAWAVVAPTNDVANGALAGEYGGVTGGAAVGVGAGANVLIGGFNHSFALQPVSIQGNTGLNVAAGIAEVSLEAQKS